MGEESGLLNQRIAERVRELRGEQNCSLQELAARSGVSRSMISLIERAESSPTAVVLEKLAAGLNVTLASFFERPVLSSQRHDHPISRRSEQPEWRDPESGYRRRNVSPAGVRQPLQITEVHFPPVLEWALRMGTVNAPSISRSGCWKASWKLRREPSAIGCLRETASRCSWTPPRCSIIQRKMLPGMQL